MGITNVLIHIGYPKAGSTYLHEWFSYHPRMLYHSHALTGFYHTHDIARYAESQTTIHDCFVLSNEDLSVWKGEVDIVGIKDARFYDVREYQERLSRTLQRIYPEAKVLIVTRGYRTYFQSLYSQYLSSGGSLSFKDFKTKFGRVFPDAYDYSFVIDLYRRVFGKDKVILLPFELLKENPKRFTALIEESLGFEQHFEFKIERVNPSFDKKVLYAYWQISNFLVKLLSVFPVTWQRKLYALYIVFLNKKRPHPLMIKLSRLMNREIVIENLEEIFAGLKGKAEILKQEELYQPYLGEYLIQ